MKILVIGGTRFFGIPMVNKLLEKDHRITIATRGITGDAFGDRVRRVKLNVYERDSVAKALSGEKYDVVIDKMGYGSLDIKNILDAVECEKFIHMSTAGVYRLNHMDIKETEFDGGLVRLNWCSRGDVEYDEAKRAAEAALCQKYSGIDWASVRCPYVLGKKDYTERLLFYVEHVMNEIPMRIDNIDAQMSFANADEVGKFLAFLTHKKQVGPINACARGTISIREILIYVERKTGCEAKIDLSGDKAPYNGTQANSLSIEKAEALGADFKNICDWLPELLDYYIEYIRKERGQSER